MNDPVNGQEEIYGRLLSKEPFIIRKKYDSSNDRCILFDSNNRLLCKWVIEMTQEIRLASDHPGHYRHKGDFIRHLDMKAAEADIEAV